MWRSVDFHSPPERLTPLIASSRLSGAGVGARRVDTLSDGAGDLHLVLEQHDPEARRYVFCVESWPLPVVNYVGRVRVRPVGPDRCELRWSASYDAAGVASDEADAALGRLHQALLDGLDAIHGRA